MSDKELPAVEGSFDFERVAEMMRRWWLGESRATIAAEMGVTPQYVGQRLAWAGCAARTSNLASLPDSPRRSTPERVEFAQLLLQHSKAGQLTARQRSALLWQAQGLILSDIAKRMGTTMQAVQSFIAGAEKRLARLESANPIKPVKLAEIVDETPSEIGLTEDTQPGPSRVEDDEPEHEAVSEDAPALKQESELAVEEPVADAPQAPPELTEADFGLPPAPQRTAQPKPPEPISPYERKPIRLSDIHRVSSGNSNWKIIRSISPE